MGDNACKLADYCPMMSRISVQEQAVKDLESWQDRQNGTLQRLEDKLDSLRNWIMGALFTALAAAIAQVIVLLTKK
jgi:hypothetical protein